VWSILVVPTERIGAARRLGERATSGQAAREILARYLGCRPEEIAIQRTRTGKPRLREADSISFSLAHSGAFGLLAVTSGRGVGVDLERIRPIPDSARLAGRFFAPSEAAPLENLQADEATEAFFRTWARKEAYVKGVGGSVPAGLRCFETASDPLGWPRILWTSLESCDRSIWELRDLPAPPGYVAALAAEGPIARVETFTV